MLEIKQVRTYKIPRYPQEIYFRPSSNRKWPVAACVLSAVTLSLLTTSCDPIGTTGPPPVPSGMITEREARTAINAIFTKNGITLEEDVPFVLTSANQTKVNLEIDGFNNKLNVGYEYISPGDEDTFSREVIGGLQTKSGKGPYIKTIDAQRYDGDVAEAYKRIETQIQDFINELKAKGVI